MTITEQAERLRERYGTHLKVADLLMVHWAYYSAIRNGRVRPSRRLRAAMEKLLKEAEV